MRITDVPEGYEPYDIETPLEEAARQFELPPDRIKLPHEVFDPETLKAVLAARERLKTNPRSSRVGADSSEEPAPAVRERRVTVPSPATSVLADLQGTARADDEDVPWTDEDLAAETLHSRQGHRFVMPGTRKVVWVFGLNTEDKEEMHRRARPFLRRVREAKSPEEMQFELAMVQPTMRVLQMIAACRQANDPESPRTFKWERVNQYRLDLNEGLIEELCMRCDAASGSAGPSLEALRAFFTVAQDSLLTLSSASKSWDDSLKESREAVDRLELAVTCVLSLEKSS